MIYGIDILLDDDNDLLIANGDFVTGESVLQETSIILGLNSGELRSDPVLAPNLVQLINSKAKPEDFESRTRIHLARDGKNYDELKGLITLKKIL